VWSQDNGETLADKITSIGEDLLEDYTQPFTTAFGTAVVTGLFHSAYSHDFLGFDIGVRAMYIYIPEDAQYFQATALLCSLQAGELVCETVQIDSVSTIFGPEEDTDVSTENAVGVPPLIPGGFNLTGVPFAMPQVNVGLVYGSEIALRYLPPVEYKGSKMRFLGIGVKQELTKIPGLPMIPFAIAVGAAYQAFNCKDDEGAEILNSETWCVQLIASKRIAVFEPYVAVGLENTRIHFHYDFEYELPSPVDDYTVTFTEPIDVTLTSQTTYRAVAGFTLRMGFLYAHYDFNFTQFKTHNLIAGITFR
jgi:hypothetical protein